MITTTFFLFLRADQLTVVLTFPGTLTNPLTWRTGLVLEQGSAVRTGPTVDLCHCVTVTQLREVAPLADVVVGFLRDLRRSFFSLEDPSRLLS